MVKTFRHGGKTGDVIFSLPAIRELGGGILYIPENTPDEVTGMFTNMKSLLELQPYIHEVREYPSGLGYMELAPGITIDYDLDRARLQPAKGVVHIVKRYLDAFDINIPNWKEPWLHLDTEPGPFTGEYIVFNYTARHVINERKPAPPFDWKQLYDSVEGRKVFVGSPDEFQAFKEMTGIEEYVPTKDALELARVIRDAKAVYCNQSLTLALAQALGVTYYVYPKPFKTNCLL